MWGNLSKFGTSPFRFFLSIFIIIFLFAFLAFFGDKGLRYSGGLSYVDSFFESLYWSFVTFTTLGYGDIGPDSTFTKILAILEAFLGLIMMGFFLDLIATKYHEFRRGG
ncbi:MAG: two pore domain potassium channel family protein [Candidatus Aminicenantes bacterium]|nr:two pore domain potassium channel family protein [Candidatus Aminicenantes bacterium]